MLLSRGDTVARRRDDDRNGDDRIDRDPDRVRPRDDRPAARRRARSRVPSRRGLADAGPPVRVRGRARHARLPLVVSGRRRRGTVPGRRAAGHAGADPDRRERARDRVGARRRRGAVRVDAGERARRGRAGARPRRDTPARVARRGGAGRRVDHVPGRRLPREPRARRGVPRRGGGPRPPHAAGNRRSGDCSSAVGASRTRSSSWLRSPCSSRPPRGRGGTVASRRAGIHQSEPTRAASSPRSAVAPRSFSGGSSRV